MVKNTWITTSVRNISFSLSPFIIFSFYAVPDKPMQCIFPTLRKGNFYENDSFNFIAAEFCCIRL